MKNVRVMGIDVGFAINGWSIVDKDPSFKNGMNLVDYGAILTEAKTPIEDRLAKVYEELNDLIIRYTPDMMSVENLFFFKNQKTVINVGQVRGIILLAGKLNNVDIHSYTPLQVKTAVTGYGRADKSQIQKMVKLIFGLKEIPKPDDAADAIAAAVCDINNMKISNMNEFKI